MHTQASPDCGTWSHGGCSVRDTLAVHTLVCGAHICGYYSETVLQRALVLVPLAAAGMWLGCIPQG